MGSMTYGNQVHFNQLHHTTGLGGDVLLVRTNIYYGQHCSKHVNSFKPHSWGKCYCLTQLADGKTEACVLFLFSGSHSGTPLTWTQWLRTALKQCTGVPEQGEGRRVGLQGRGRSSSTTGGWRVGAVASSATIIVVVVVGSSKCGAVPGPWAAQIVSTGTNEPPSC